MPLVLIRPTGLSIADIAGKTIGFYRDLMNIDSTYRFVKLISELEPEFKVIDVLNDKAIEMLSKEILHQNVHNLRTIYEVAEPSVYSGKDSSISFSLETVKGGLNLITLHFGFSPVRSYIGVILIGDKFVESTQTGMRFLQAAIDNYDVTFACIRIFNRGVNSITRKYKFPIGWINYFPDDSSNIVPTGINDVVFEKTETGTFVVVSMESLNLDEENIEAYKSKVLDIMKMIAEIDPSYVR